MEEPVAADRPTSRVPSSRGWSWRKVLVALATIFFVGSAATARLFIWPTQGMPPRVDAIVMLDGPGQALRVAERLAAQHRASYLVVSQGTPASRDPCPAPVPGVRLVCFHPRPATTRGEAEFVGRLARQHHWRSVAVVAIVSQASRARLRVERCFPGRVYTVAAAIPLSSWPYQIAYEWGALVKALVTQRAC